MSRSRPLNQVTHQLGDIDQMMYLSELARQTRKPGQTLQSRLNELRREVGG